VLNLGAEPPRTLSVTPPYEQVWFKKGAHLEVPNEAKENLTEVSPPGRGHGGGTSDHVCAFLGKLAYSCTCIR
jgi:hypothetical protein